MAGMGLLGLTLPPSTAAFGGGAMDAMALMEAIGEALIVEPWLPTVALGARLVAAAGTDARSSACSRRRRRTRTMAFAHAEDGARHSLAHVAARAVADGDGFVLNGTKRASPMRTPRTRSSYRRDRRGEAPRRHRPVPGRRGAPGMTTHALRMLDGTRAADVALDGVRVSRDACVGCAGDALPLIEATIDFATALVCAEAAGAIGAANDATLEYLKTRKQFGVAIGTFQALQHRMVDLAIELEQVKSMASLACAAVDSKQDPESRGRVVSAAKVAHRRCLPSRQPGIGSSCTAAWG
jgi:alkylation response protein AidB-like acyl-CoA dehydrogenase